MKKINNFLSVSSSKTTKQDQYLLTQTASSFAINLKTGLTILSENSIIKLIPNSEFITSFNKFILNNLSALSYSKYTHSIKQKKSQVLDQSQQEIFFNECKLKILHLLQILTLYVQSNNYNLPEKLSSFSFKDNGLEKTIWVEITNSEENTRTTENKLKQIIIDEIMFRLNNVKFNFPILNQNYEQITNIILKEINIKQHQHLKSQILRIKSIIRGLKFEENGPKKLQKDLMSQLQLNLSQNRSCLKQKQVSYNRKENKIGNEQGLRLSLKNVDRKKSYKLLKEKSTKRKGSTLNPCRNSFAELKKSLNNDSYLKNTFSVQKQQNGINYLAILQQGCIGPLIPHLSLNQNNRDSRKRSKQQKEHIRQIRQDILKQFQTNFVTDENKKSKGELETEETQKNISDALENEIFVSDEIVEDIGKNPKVFPKNFVKEISNRLEETIDPIGQAVPFLRKQLKNTPYKFQIPLYLLYKKFLYLRAAFLSVISSENAPTQLFPKVTQQQWQKQIVKREYLELVKKIEDENESIHEGLSLLHKKICSKNKENDSKVNRTDKKILEIVIEDQKVYEEFVKQMFVLNFEILKKIRQNSEIEQSNQEQICFVYSRVLITAIHDDLLEYDRITPHLKQKLMQFISKPQTYSTSQTFSLLTQIASLFNPEDQ